MNARRPSCRELFGASGGARWGFACAIALVAQLPTESAAQQDASTAPPPALLQCLARYYAMTPTRVNGHWFGSLPDDTQIPYEDHAVKSFDERLDRPDLEDMFSMPYPRGEIGPVTKVDFDPGRIRVAALFAATYGLPPEDGELSTVRFFGTTVRVHRRVAAPLRRVVDKLDERASRDPALRAYLSASAGGFVRRAIAGTVRVSPHAFGIAIDLNPAHADYWQWHAGAGIRWRNRIPAAIVDGFESEGFIWGGRWYHYDTMHFEYRPELLDPRCARDTGPTD